MSEKEFTLKNYFDALAEGKLIGSKCKKCGKMYVPPKKFCAACQSTDMEWITCSGKGKLETFSLVNVGTPYFNNQGYSMKKPYCFAVVRLEEGAAISGHMVGKGNDIDFEGAPKNFKIGMPVKARFIKIGAEGKEQKTDLGFEPV